jgi:hypothetical protein
MIRIRRLPQGRFRRPKYEVELTQGDDYRSEWSRVTRTPVTLIDPILGVGDAWALVHAANEAWDGHVGAWVSLFHKPSA